MPAAAQAAASDGGDRARRGCQVEPTAAQPSQAAARASHTDRDARAGERALEVLGDGFGERVDRAGPVDGDDGLCRAGRGPARRQRHGRHHGHRQAIDRRRARIRGRLPVVRFTPVSQAHRRSTQAGLGEPAPASDNVSTVGPL